MGILQLLRLKFPKFRILEILNFLHVLQRQRNKDTDSPERSPNTSFTNEFITDDQRTSDVTRLRQRRMSTQLKVKFTNTSEVYKIVIMLFGSGFVI